MCAARGRQGDEAGRYIDTYVHCISMLIMCDDEYRLGHICRERETLHCIYREVCASARSLAFHAYRLSYFYFDGVLCRCICARWD